MIWDLFVWKDEFHKSVNENGFMGRSQGLDAMVWSQDLVSRLGSKVVIQGWVP